MVTDAAEDAERLAEVRALGPIEVLAGAAFDALARVAAATCGTPIALVTIIDAEHQHLIARVGDSTLAGGPRADAFCNHVVATQAPMVIPDATRDPRFAHNPHVVGADGLRFYAGAPLMTERGHVLGAVCVLDRVPRTLEPAHAQVLADLARAAMAVLGKRRLAREVTRASEDLAMVLDGTPDMFAVWNRDLTNRFANAAYRRFFGHAESITGRHISAVIGPALFADNLPLLQRTLDGERQVFERRRPLPNGGAAVAIGEYTPYWVDGRVDGVIVTLTDVSPMRAALDLAEERTTLLEMAEALADVGHFRLDVDAGTLYWSPQVYRIQGLDPDRFTPTLDNAIACYHPEERERVAAIVSHALETGTSYAFESRVVRPTGEVRHVLSRGRVERAHGPRRGTVLIGVFQDVTEHEALHERLRRQERLATIGTLAAGVGHEINNPLTFVTSNLDVAIEDLQAMAGAAPAGRMKSLMGLLEDAKEGSQRIRKIVRGLRLFARPDVVNPIAIDVNAALDMSLNIAAHEVRHRASVAREFGHPPLVMADDAQLSQIFVNLIVNAAQAFPAADAARNVVTVRTSTTPSGAARVEIADNGPGIAPEVAARMFDPFFTTKAPGDGTGLGLAICQSVAQLLDGELTYETRPGVGTTFALVLPAAPTSPAELPAPADAAVGGPARGRVMVIDDEPSLLRTLSRMLSAHEVVTFEDPRAALALLRAEGATFDVVFSDLMMPHMTGIELYRAVVDLAPTVAERFVFMTGALIRDDIATFLGSVPNERFEKPFSPQNIRGVVNRHVAARVRSDVR